MAAASKGGLQVAVDYLTDDSAGDGASVRQKEMKSSVAVVEETARREGLTPGHIHALADFIASGNANSSLSSRVVRCLIPGTSVPCSAVLRLLGSLKGQTLSLKLLIIRWILLVYDIIDNDADLHSVYGIVFYYLQIDELRQVVCQLLCYMTRKSDVTLFRVQRLTELVKHVDSSKGAENGLTALLTVYHTYCPHMVARPRQGRKSVWFRPFEKQLASNIKRVQQLQKRQSDSGGADGEGERVVANELQRRLDTAPPPMKRQRKTGVTSVPNVLSSAVNGRRGGEGETGKVSFGEMTLHRDLCDNITRVEFPSQMASVLSSRVVQHMFSVCREPSAVLRFTYWLEHSLGYELDEYSPGHENSDLHSLLNYLHQLTQFLMEPIPTVESFLHILLEEWNGDDYRHEILSLLSHLSLQSFDNLEESYLEPLKRHFVSKDREFKCACLLCFSKLLKNMALFEWPRHQKRAAVSSGDQTSHRVSLFSSDAEEDVEDFNPLATIRLFIKYVDHLILIALEQENQHLLILHFAMMFYEVVAGLRGVYSIPHLSLPTPSILFSGLLGHSPVHLDRACAHIIRVKKTLSDLKRNERSLQLTQMFNSVVLDFCDALWRNMIFKNSKRPYPTLVFHMSRSELESCSLQQCHKRLNLVHHPAMAGLILQFFRETQDAERLHLLAPSAIWQEARFKQVYLEFLRQNHLGGIAAFIETFVHTN